MAHANTLRIALIVAMPLVIVLAVMATLRSTTASAQSDTPLLTSRVAGDSRESTAVAISQRVFPDGAATGYLARSDNPVDANVAGTVTDGPILLIPFCGDLPGEVASELERLAPTELVALGGTAAICDQMFNQAAAAAQGSATDFVTVDGVPVDPETIPFTDRQDVDIELFHCGFIAVDAFGRGWLPEEPPFDATNAPQDWVGSGVLRLVEENLTVFFDEGPSRIPMVPADELPEPAPCA